MASINRAILIGNLGKKPEVRYLPNGDAVANFSLATSENYKNKEGVKVEKTEWHNIVMYRKVAEIAEQYLDKGSSVYIEGKIQYSSYEKDGVTRYMTHIVADKMQMLGGKPSDSSNENEPRAKAPVVNAEANLDFDDDIGF